MVRFIDRKEELEILEKDYKNLKNAFIVVYGRRRLGKTRLIDEFLKNKDSIRYTAADTSTRIQIREFQQALSNNMKDEFLAKQEIDSWGGLLAYLQKVLPKDKRLVIWIDEFSYLIKSDPAVTSYFQQFIDHFLRNSKIFLIISGSILGLMSEKILSNSSPLYGRRTRDLLMHPISFPYARQFLKMNFEDSLRTYFTLNGIPEYLLIAIKYNSYSAFISEEFLKRDGYFYREPFFLLSQEFKEIKIYFSIMNAIAYGNSKPTEIANFVGIKAREIYPYLELLIQYGFIARETPTGGDKKAGIYHIKDNFFDFWFNFVHKHRGEIESGAYKIKDNELETFFGKRFEVFIRETAGILVEGFEKWGRWWHKETEIDLVMLKSEKKEILFGECKWRSNVDGEMIVKTLMEKTKYMDWMKGERKEQYIIFAKSFKQKPKIGKAIDLKDMEKIFTVKD